MSKSNFALSLDWAAATSLSIAAIFFVSNARADDLADCVSRRITFDGITPLRYGMINAGSGSNVYLHASFPPQCKTDAKNCTGPAYIIKGDVVAVGKSCGDWAYVQYIGKTRVTEGWVGVGRLDILNSKWREAGLASRAATTDKAIFKTKLGRGVPVCEAYLQRLNQTDFVSPPFCGRPESDRVPGFLMLHRVALTGDELVALFPAVDSLLIRGHSVPAWNFDPIDRLRASQGGGGPAIFAWRYDPRVDIDNDNVSDSLVIWTGPPVDYNNVPCGSNRDSSGNYLSRPIRWMQIALIMSKQGTDIDDARTIEVFEHPNNGLAVGNAHVEAASQGFMPIGSSISFFQYRGVTYFDTFFQGGGWADFNGRRANMISLDDRLAVFLRRDGTTRQMCEYALDTEVSDGGKKRGGSSE